MKKAYLYGCIALFFWSTIAAATKMMLSSLGSMQILSVTMLYAAVFLLLLNVWKGNLRHFRSYRPKDYCFMFFLGAIGLFLYKLLLYIGIDSMMASQAFIINYLWPIMTVIFACLILKEPLTVKKAIAIALAFAGVIIVTADGSLQGLGKESLLGALCCILAAVCYGLFAVLNKQKGYDNLFSMLIYHIAAWLLSTLFNFLSGDLFVPQAAQLPGLLWLGVGCSAVAYVFWAKALELGDTAKISTMAYITPFLSLIWTALLLNEPIRLSSVLGLVVIISGILLQMKDKKT